MQKRGRTTGLTGGNVYALHVNTVDMSLQNMMSVIPNVASGSATATFGDHGDSGSAVLKAAGEITALLFAVSLPAPPPAGGGPLPPPPPELGSGYCYQGEDRARRRCDPARHGALGFVVERIALKYSRAIEFRAEFQ